MNSLRRPIRLARVILPLVGLVFWAPRVAHADPVYKIQPVFKAGDTAGDVVIPANYALWPGGFSDRGQVILDAFNPKKAEGEFVLQVTDGKPNLIARPGGDGPSGAWPQDLFFRLFASNARGTVLLDASTHSGAWPGLYRWDADSGKLTQVLKQGMPAGADWTIDGDGAGLCVNTLDEIAVALKVRNASGNVGFGIFFIGRDGQWQPVLLPGQELPGGGKVHDEALHPLSCNDAGRVAFLARREGEKQYSAFLWDQGKISQVLGLGADTPAGKKIASVSGAWVNDANREVIVTAGVDPSGSQGIYRVVDGTVIPVIVVGQQLPGGGRLGTLPYDITDAQTFVVDPSVGQPNQKGQLPFLAVSTANLAAVYVMAPDGVLSLVVKKGQGTDQGKIQSLAAPVLLDSNGEVAVVLTIEKGPSEVAILIPSSP